MPRRFMGLNEAASRRLPPGPVLLAAAALALVLLREAAPTANRASRLRLRLVRRLGAIRPVEGRLVGFGYAPPGAGRAPGSRDRQLALSARQIRDEAERSGSPAARADYAVVKLLDGKLPEAVSLLEKVVEDQPANAPAWSDLAAAYLAAGAASPRSYARAFSAANRAVIDDRTLAEARFNRAVALEKLHLDRDARSAWEEVARLDPDRGWSEEARSRLRRLELLEQGAAWDSVLPRLEQAALAGGAAGRTTVRELVARFPQESRLEAEERLLPAWAAALVRHGPGQAEDRLAAAREIGQALAATPGDRLVAESALAIARAAGDAGRLRALRDGHLDYAAGLALLSRRDFEAAEADFGEARRLLWAGGSPMALWADFHLAACAFYRASYSGVEIRLEGLERRLASRPYPALRARAWWLRGLLEIVQGSLGESLRHYTDALAAFTALHERENAGTVDSLLAEDLRLLGEADSGWRHRIAAVASTRVNGGASPHLQSALAEAAVACLEEHDTALAGLFQDEAIRVARAAGDPHHVAEGYLRRIPIDVAAGDDRALDHDVAAVRQSASAIPSAELRRRLAADALAAAAEADIRRRPRQAVSDFTEALDFYASSGFALPRAGLLVKRARAYQRFAAIEDAERDLRSSLAELEGVAGRIVDRGLRLDQRRRALPTYRELAQLDWGLHRDPCAAFAIAESALGEPPTAGSCRTLRGLSTGLPEAAAVVELELLPDRLLAWTITSDGISWSERELAAARLASEVDRLHACLERGETAAAREILAELYDWLARPLPAQALGKGLLVLVPDEALMGLPFAALLRRESGRYLVEDRAVMTAPSAGSVLRRLGREAAPAAPRRALVVGGPAFDRDLFPNLDTLPASEAEARTIGDLYPGATVLTGSQATPTRVLDAVGRHEVVHLGTHTLGGTAGSPLILLSPARRGRDSGTLSSRDILGADLRRVRLAVLASCGRPRQLSGSASLAGAFLEAGVESVVESLWRVDDRATADLFVEFHRLAAGGAPPAEALRQAQLRQLRAGGPGGPLTWASFQLVSGAVQGWPAGRTGPEVRTKGGQLR
jgi:CHAT domain-containing protein